MSRASLLPAVLALFSVLTISAPAHASEQRLTAFSAIDWPQGSSVVAFENLEGLVLIEATLQHHGERDTTGLLALDTGAGFLALDERLAQLMNVHGGGAGEAIGYSTRALGRLMVGSLRIDQVTPLLTFDSDIVRRVTDRPVFGLLGQRPLTGRAIWIDYAAESLAIVPVAQTDAARERNRAIGGVPPSEARAMAAIAASRKALGDGLGDRARPVAFALAGDGKMIVTVRLADPDTSSFSEPLTLIVDTGATRSVLFDEALDEHVKHHASWPAARGLSAPTLYGDAVARLARVPSIHIDTPEGEVALNELDLIVIRSDLSRILSRGVRQPVHGLIGYSFLKHFRVCIDYVNRVMWLDRLPEGWENRPYRDTNVGLQVERIDGALRVAGVAADSPADEAGIRLDDEVIFVNGESSERYDVPSMLRAFEGAPGTPIELTLRRGRLEWTSRLVRRKLF